MVGFEDTGYTVRESEGRVTVCVAIISPNDLLLTGSLSVTVNISAESSNNGMARGKLIITYANLKKTYTGLYC